MAEVPLSGDLAGAAGGALRIYARAVREDDGLMVAPWTPCALSGIHWSVTLTLPQGGLYRLEACAQEEGCAIEWSPRIKNVCHVGVGELFLLTGQSNMAGYGRDAAYDPPQLGVHLFGNDGTWKLATHPLNDALGTLFPENREPASGSSPALAFGRMLSKRLNLPVGLVQASLGGSPLSAWHPEEDGILYRAMLRRLDYTGPVGGVLWYQGCSDANAENAPRYLERFSRMVALWRAQLGPVPFVTVQLNRWMSAQGEEDDRMWGLVREAQRQAARTLRGVYLAPTIDLSISDGIHNSSGANVIIGERMAQVLLAGHYGLPGAQAPDLVRAVALDDTHVLLAFRPEDDVLPMDQAAPGIDVEDGEGLTGCIRAEVRREGLVLTTGRAFTLPARLNALWRCQPPACTPRSRYGMPMLSCYGVEIEPSA